jgi:hypothetical protein
MPGAPAAVYLVHGEAGPMDALKQMIVQRLGWNVHTPAQRETIAI